jgi:hypothetical protein
VVRELDHPPGAVLSFLRIGVWPLPARRLEIVCRWEDFADRAA